jgi:HEAT repeat protein
VIERGLVGCFQAVALLVFCVVGFAPTLHGQPKTQTLPDWLTDFDSADVIVRRAAATKLKCCKMASDPQVIGRISRLLQEEKDAQVRLSILDVVVDLGEQAQLLIPPLVESLRKETGGRKNEELHQDHREALALASIGPKAVDGLRELLACSRANVRAEAAMALAKMGSSASAAMRDVLPLLDDKDERVRTEGTKALTAFGADIRADLIAAFTRSSMLAQCGIVRALGQMPDKDDMTINIILGAMKSEDVDLRISGLDVLEHCDLDPMQSQSILLSNLRHSNESVRRAVIRQLADHFQSALPTMKVELLKLVSGGESGVDRDAAFLVTKLNTEGAQGLVDEMHHPACNIEVVADALGTMGNSVFELLADSMSSQNSSVRRGCVLALGQIRPLPEKAIDVLITGLEDVEPTVQLASLRALGRLQSRARKSKPYVQLHLQHSDATIRATAYRVLFEIGPRNSELVGLLQSGLNDEADEVQLIALDSLRSAGPVAKVALPIVIEKLSSRKRPIQLSALAMVANYGRTAAAASPKLIPLLQDETDPELTLAVLQTLTQFGNEAAAAIEPVKQLLHASDSRVRAAAIDVFSNLELPVDQVQPILTPLFADSDQEVRKRSLRAIRKYGDQGILYVADLIAQVKIDEKADSYLLREIQRLERFDVAERTVAPLLMLLDHTNPKIVELASKFLGRVQPRHDEIVRRLSALREHSDPAVRETVEKALKSIP